MEFNLNDPMEFFKPIRTKLFNIFYFMDKKIKMSNSSSISYMSVVVFAYFSILNKILTKWNIFSVILDVIRNKSIK